MFPARGLAIRSPHPLLVFLLVGLLHGSFALLRGPIVSADTTTYSTWADAMREGTFDFESSKGYPPILYSGWVAMVALARSLFGNQWSVAIVVLNVLANAAVATLLVRSVALVTSDSLACWFALAWYAISFDLLLWTPYVLSDPTFLFLSFAAFAITGRAWHTKHKQRAIAAAIAVSLVAAIYRPNGVLVPISLLLSWLILRSKRKSALVVGGVVIALSIVILNAYLVIERTRPSGPTHASALDHHADLYREGVVVFGRPETWNAKPQTPLDVISITFDRFAHFFRFTHPSFSARHNILAILFFVPAYFLALVGAVSSRKFPSPMVTTALVFVVVFWFFTSLVQVDFDWRYRLPLLPHLIFLAAVGIAHSRRIIQSDARGASTP